MTLITASERVVKRAIFAATVIICGLVVLLNQKVIPHPATYPRFIYQLPMLNAFINGTCSVLLLFSLSAIKKKKIELHRKLNTAAFALSCIFLLSYVTAHYFIPDTRYGDADHDGLMSVAESAAVSASKPWYLLLLLTHILFAVVVLPLVLLSFYYGLTDQRPKHRKLTRFSYPIWLYVTISGVVVYVMISPYYNY